MKTQTLIGREREDQILALLRSYREGLRLHEIAKNLNCHSSRIRESLLALEGRIPICIDEDEKYILYEYAWEKMR